MKIRWRWVVVMMCIIPAMSMFWLTLTEDGLQWFYQQLKPYVFGQLSVESVQGRLIGPVVLTGVDFQQQGLHIRSQKMELNWLPRRLMFAQVEISSVHIQNLEIMLTQNKQTPAQHKNQSGEIAYRLPEVKLPVNFALRDVKVEGLAIHQSQQITRIKEVNTSLKSISNRIEIERFMVSADDYQLLLVGDVTPSGNYPHDLRVEWMTRLSSDDLVEGKGRIHGDIDKTQINQQLMAPSSVSFNANVFTLLQKPTWRARIEVDKFDSTNWKVELPELKGTLKMTATGDLETAEFSGHLDAQRSDTGPFKASFNMHWLQQKILNVDDLTLQVEQSATLIKTKGQWKPGDAGGDINVAVDWKNLRWPIQRNAVFNSANGKGSIEGNLHSYRFRLQTDKFLPELPDSNWVAHGEGNQTGMNMKQVRVEILDGEIEAKGKLNWSPELSWQAEVDGSDINPVSLHPEWPGQLNLSLTNRGQFVDGQITTEVDIQGFNGTLRDYPVALTSQLSWRDQGLDIKKLNFSSGASELTVNGRVDQTLGLDWSIRSGNLAELLPATKGTLQAHGKFTGSRAQPIVKAAVKGRALSFLGYRAGLVEGKVLLNLANTEQLDVNLNASAVSFQRYSLDSLNIHGNAKKVQITASSDDFKADIGFTGEVMESGWTGQIQRADLDLHDLQQWRLIKPVKISFNSDAVKTEQLCWTNPTPERERASVCTKLERSGESWRSELQLGQFPLQLLDRWLPSGLKLDGRVDAQADVTLEANQLMGKVDMDLLPGMINYPLIEGEHKQWHYQSGKIRLSLTQQGLQSLAEISFSGDESIQASFAMPGANLLALDLRQQPIQGQAKLTLHKLDFIDLMLPEVQKFQGTAKLNISLAGLFDQPRIKGRVELQQGSLSIPRLGLKIAQLELTGRSDGPDKVNFTLSGVSGDGKLEVQGFTLLDKQSGWPTEMTIKGSNFEVSHIPEARVTASPDISIKLRLHHVEITGEVVIPYAHIQPRDISTATRVSSDVVIVGQQQREDKWDIVSRVKLILGERVHFYGFGFEGRLAGNVQLEDDPGLPTRARGVVIIAQGGRYRAFGQRLDIEQGKLLFSGGPLINPGLDIRAVRKVDTVTAGIRVRGNVNEPQVELFSTPAMGQTDMLSYLLLGRPIEQTSEEEGSMMAKAALALGLSGGDRLARRLRDRFGLDEFRVATSDSGDQASLVVGRYLSPRLYVSYGIGLLEAFNTVLVRYRISDQWQLKAESGEVHGADIIFSIER